jgi:Ca2+-binding RTX toxin-like protein
VGIDLLFGLGHEGDAEGDIYTGIENATGGSFADGLQGNDNDNVLDGGAGDDALVGGGGNDILIGNDVSNLLQGGVGSDTLGGGFGTDRLQGGADGDIFTFGGPGDSQDYALRSDGKKLSPDIIGDFLSGSDKIDLSAIDANLGAAGDQAFTWIGAGAFSGTAGQLRADIVGSQVHIYGDIDGNGRADLHIIASGSQILVGDFIL